MTVAIVNIVFMIGQKFYVDYWNGAYVNSQPSDDFESRWAEWSKIINLSDANHRFMVTGLAVNGISGRAHNYKTLMDTELNRKKGYSTLFAYRELYPVSEFFYYSIISGDAFSPHKGTIIKRANFMPPSVRDVVKNINFIDFLGVNFLISADDKLPSEHFQLIDAFRIDHEQTPRPDQNGVVYLYKNLKAGPIAFSTKILDNNGVIKCDQGDLTKNKYVFDYNYVVLDSEFFKFCAKDEINPIKKIPAEILSKSANTIKIRVYNNDLNDTLFMSITNRKFFQAEVNSSVVDIQDSMMGLMALPIQKGYNEINIKYVPYDVYLSYFIVILFLSWLLLSRNSFSYKNL
jgi:hypothetical protein